MVNEYMLGHDSSVSPIDLCLPVDLFFKTDDEFTGIDFLAELDKDGKMYTDGKPKLFKINWMHIP